MLSSGTAAMGSLSQRHETPPNRPATELEQLIAEIGVHLNGTLVALHEIRRRVMTPKSEPQDARVARVPTTYADRVRDLIETAAEINEIATELNGPI